MKSINIYDINLKDADGQIVYSMLPGFQSDHLFKESGKLMVPVTESVK